MEESFKKFVKLADIYPRFGKAMEWDVAAGDFIYRNSARSGEHPSPLRYNTESLVVEGFILGIDDTEA